MAAVSKSLLLASNSSIQLSSGSSFNADQSIRTLCPPTLSITPSIRKSGYKRLAVHAAYSDDSRLSSSSVFIGGFILGGLVVGTLGCVYAPQISKALAGTDRKDLMRKLPKFIYDEEKALEKTRKILTEKIAQLNSAIDDVSSQLRTDNAPNGAVVNPDEMEATI